jgi:hypothetical protein
MDLKLFTDVLDAIEKAFKAIKVMANLPKQTRDELRGTFDDTFKLLDTSLSMIIIRLGEIIRITEDANFIKEVNQLSNDVSWTQSEREFRLCKSLRHAVNEIGRLRNKILSHISVQDWDALQSQMESILWSEDKLGNYIAAKFLSLSGLNVIEGQPTQQIRNELKQFQDSLNNERRILISMEIDLYSNF